MNIDYLLSAHGFGGKKSKDKIPPPRVIGFRATRNGANADLSWTNPTDTDFVGVLILKKLGGYPTSPTDGEVVYKGNSTKFTDTNVRTAQYVYYRAFSYDFDGNYNVESGQTAWVLVKGSQSTPSAPIVDKVDYNSVALRAQSGCEYKIANGSWQSSNIFTNLSPNTSYTFYQRKKENTYYNPSSQSSGTSVTTLKPPYRTMTAVIDQSNSNPLTCITYEDDARTMTKGSSEWDKFFGAKLVLFKNGREVRDLKDSELNNLTESDGDVMVKFKRMGLNIKTVGDKVYVSMTDNADSEDFKYYAHTRGTERRETFYLGAYLGYEKDGKLRSIKGFKPTGEKTIGDFRTIAQANGSGYEQLAFYQWTFLQAMYVLKYGNLDSQTALGKGLTSGSGYLSTGGTNGKGVDFGSTNGGEQMRFQYIEDMWGNKLQWLDGIKSVGNSQMKTGTDKFSNDGASYSAHNLGFSIDLYDYVKNVQGTSELGFVIKAKGGSTSTYFCDYQYVYGNSENFGCVGGYRSYGARAGAFCFYCSDSASRAYANFGGRLMFL